MDRLLGEVARRREGGGGPAWAGVALGGLLGAVLSADFLWCPGGTRENGWVGIPEGVSGYPTPNPLKDFVPTTEYGL